MKSFYLISRISLMITIFLGILNQPYSYYEFLRPFVFIISIIITIQAFRKDNKTGFKYLYLAIIILFNPILPLYISKDVWIIIDVLLIIAIGVSLALDKEANDVFAKDEKRNRINEFLNNYTENSQFNNNQKEEVSTKQSNSVIKTASKQKVWKPLALVSLVINAVLIGVAFWVYTKLIKQEYMIDKIQAEVESVTKELSDSQEDYNTLIDQYVSLETEYMDYVEQAVAEEDIVEEATNNEPFVEVAKEVSELVNNPEGAFTQGSSKNHVKKIMGTPSSLNKRPLGGETWWYGGTAYVNFDVEGLVEGWTDISGDTLKVQ